MKLANNLINKEELWKRCEANLDLTKGKLKGEPFIIVYSKEEVVEEFLLNLESELLSGQLEFSNIIEFLLGDKDRWGYSNRYSKCSTCDNIIYFGEKDLLNNETAFFINVVEGQVNCADCVTDNKSLQLKYLDFITNNCYMVNTILAPDKFYQAGFKPYQGKLITDKSNVLSFDLKQPDLDQSTDLFAKLQANGYQKIIFDLVAEDEYIKKFKVWVSSN